ncbi:TPA: DUF1317 family protein, partial [Yersinia enterocolitica]
MKTPYDHVKVGSITLIYSRRCRGWIAPGGRVITNPLTAQRTAERINS